MRGAGNMIRGRCNLMRGPGNIRGSCFVTRGPGNVIRGRFNVMRGTGNLNSGRCNVTRG